MRRKRKDGTGFYGKYSDMKRKEHRLLIVLRLTT